MERTGIVRRIDDLGRVVIPRDIRNVLAIHVGDPLEVFIDGGAVVFKKYDEVIKAMWERFIDDRESTRERERNDARDSTRIILQRLLSWALVLIALCSIVIAVYASVQMRAELELVTEYEIISFDALNEVSALREENCRLQSELDELRETLTNATYDAEFGYDYGYVVRVVGAEAQGEPFDGILAVAQCIAESAERMDITPEEVCKMPNRYAAPVSRAANMETVNEACLLVFAEGCRPFDEPIEFFYSTRGGYQSAWHENNLVFCFEIGSHRFFKRAEVLV